MLDLALIVTAWLAYGALHSALAGNAAKHWVARHWPGFWPAYRLAFNLLAILLLLPVLWLTYRSPGPPLWHVPGWIAWPALTITAAGFGWSTRWYDGSTFLGLRQWKRHIGPDDQREAFTLSPLHRHVRHPWYALGLLFLWTRDMNAAWLAATSMITLYLFLGSRLEEKKLLALYGDAYRKYRQQVPGLIPIPGRFLSEREATALETEAKQTHV